MKKKPSPKIKRLRDILYSGSFLRATCAEYKKISKKNRRKNATFTGMTPITFMKKVLTCRIKEAERIIYIAKPRVSFENLFIINIL